MATKNRIRKWLHEAKRNGATHLMVLCDTCNYIDYPFEVLKGTAIELLIEQYSSSIQNFKIMGVYALHLDIEKQLAEERAWHIEYPEQEVSQQACQAEREFRDTAVVLRRDLKTSKETIDKFMKQTKDNIEKQSHSGPRVVEDAPEMTITCPRCKRVIGYRFEHIESFEESSGEYIICPGKKCGSYIDIK